MIATPLPQTTGLAPPGKSAGPGQVALKSPLSRNAVIALSVVLLHIGVIWALQSGLLMRIAEIVVPVEILAQMIEPPVAPTPPRIEPVSPAPKPAQAPVKALPKAPSAPAPAPQPLAITDPTPSPTAPPGVVAPQQAAAPIEAVGTGLVATAPALSSVVQMPSSNADYLQNPPPPYPPISRRLNEQGRSTVRVLIGADGLPQRAEIARSSGFERLDQAALATVMRWRYVPGKRGGVPEAMWFNVPINWVLE